MAPLGRRNLSHRSIPSVPFAHLPPVRHHDVPHPTALQVQVARGPPPGPLRLVFLLISALTWRLPSPPSRSGRGIVATTGPLLAGVARPNSADRHPLVGTTSLFSRLLVPETASAIPLPTASAATTSAHGPLRFLFPRPNLPPCVTLRRRPTSSHVLTSPRRLSQPPFFASGCHGSSFIISATTGVSVFMASFTKPSGSWSFGTCPFLKLHFFP